MKKDPNQYPPGLNLQKVKAIIDHYDNQTDDEAIAEAEAAYKAKNAAMVSVPKELVSEVIEFIESHKKAS